MDKDENRAASELQQGGGPAIPRGGLQADTANTLRKLITEGVYRAGDHLTERELCVQLGVSRSMVRETLHQLKAEQLIDIIPNRGPIVKSLCKTELLEVLEVRTALMVLMARRFAAARDTARTDVFEAAIRDFGEALKDGDTHVIKFRKAKLYEAFMAGCDSDTLNTYFRQVNARVSYIWASSLMFSGRPDESIRELLALVKAIRAGDADAAAHAMAEHEKNARDVAIYGLEAVNGAQRKGGRGRKRG